MIFFVSIKNQKKYFSGILASGHCAYGEADKIRPEDDSQHAFPESEMQKSDGKKPSREPEKSREAVSGIPKPL
jgi:hypothetical protein